MDMLAELKTKVEKVEAEAGRVSGVELDIDELKERIKERGGWVKAPRPHVE